MTRRRQIYQVSGWTAMAAFAWVKLLRARNCGLSCHPGCIVVESALRLFIYISVTSITSGSNADKKPRRRYPCLPVLVFVDVREAKKYAMQRTHTCHVPHCLLICGTPHVLLTPRRFQIYGYAIKSGGRAPDVDALLGFFVATHRHAVRALDIHDMP